MNLPGRVVEIVQALYEANQNLAKGTDEERRKLTIKINEQIAFELGPKWGAKRADPGRPISKDAIAFDDAPNLWIWDWQDGSTRGLSSFMVPGAAGKNVGEGVQPDGNQIFIPVAAVNHLGAVPQQPGTPEQPPQSGGGTVDLGPVISALGVIASALAGLAQQAATNDEANERRYRDLVAHFEALQRTSAPPVKPPSNGGLGGVRIEDILKIAGTVGDILRQTGANR